MSKKHSSYSKVYALHGFLGCKSDWNLFSPGALGVDELAAIDLFDVKIKDSLWLWAESFLSKLTLHPKEAPILMGCSLGGRLALHALIQRPAFWKAAIIISAHPGLVDEKKRENRVEQDLIWAERFLHEPWEPLLENWNEQAVLKTSQKLLRKESDYKREDLAFALQNWSLGQQKDLRSSIAALPLPILWIVGEKDPTFISLAQSLQFSHPSSQVQIIPQSGHRAPWDSPNVFSKLSAHWLQDVL